MLNVELKHLCTSLLSWFNSEKKILEIGDASRYLYEQFNVAKTCVICDFPIDPFVRDGWFEHVCWGEYFFLENIYNEVDLVKMEIGNFDFFRGRKRGNGKFSRT